MPLHKNIHWAYQRDRKGRKRYRQMDSPVVIFYSTNKMYIYNLFDTIQLLFLSGYHHSDHFFLCLINKQTMCKIFKYWNRYVRPNSSRRNFCGNKIKLLQNKSWAQLLKSNANPLNSLVKRSYVFNSKENKASQAIQSPRTVPFLLVSLLDGYSFPNVLVKGIVAFKH